MNRKFFLPLAVAGLLLAGGCATPPAPPPAAADHWRGVHLWVDRDRRARELIRTLPALARAGANTVVIEVNYSFEFQQHPELRQKNFITQKTAHALARAAKQNGIRLIPEFNCLGHQSFGGRAEPLLQTHPEFNETPSQSLADKKIYCLEWCPSAPGLDEIIFSLLDEMAAGFEAEAVHVGLDEVYLLGADECPRCHGKNPAELFARQVNSLHAHLVGEKKLQMLMWADRVIGTKFQGVSKYDNARNDTSAAVDLLPRDIVMCDWHYEWRKEYPSIAFLAEKNFRVWPAGFLPLKAARQLSDFSRARTTNVIGYLATTWNETSITNAPNWPPVKEILPQWK
jgi:hypothetical protein